MKCLLILLASTVAIGQIPDAPKPAPDRVEWSLIAADATVRALDVYSTHQALACGCNHEDILPGFIAKNQPAMIGFESAAVVSQWWMAKRLGPHHRKLARIMTALDAMGTLGLVAHNLTLDVPKDGMRKLGR